MIIGLGIDICSIERFEKLSKKFPKRLYLRLFNKREIDSFKGNKVSSAAKNFVVKEAALKALGTGRRLGIRWKDIELFKDNYGAPHLKFTGIAKKQLNKLASKEKKLSINVSISDDAKLAQAIVILSL